MRNNDVKTENYKCPSEYEKKALKISNLKELNKIIKLIKNSGESREKDSTYLEPLPF